MEPIETTPDLAFLESLRRRRAELRDSMSALEQALAEPAPGRVDSWAERVYVALVELAGDFQAHIDINEGPDGLHRAVIKTAPRLSSNVARLTREHVEIRELLGNLMTHVSVPGLTNVDRVRGLGMELLGTLARHRQRGSDLLFEAYETDIGGET